jgi:hypothetical protein
VPPQRKQKPDNHAAKHATDLVYENSQQTKCPGEAAVRPLDQEEEYMRGGAVGQPHLQARTIVLPGEFGGPAHRNIQNHSTDHMRAQGRDKSRLTTL